jgi:hypothetical protein
MERNVVNTTKDETDWAQVEDGKGADKLYNNNPAIGERREW